MPSAPQGTEVEWNGITAKKIRSVHVRFRELQLVDVTDFLSAENRNIPGREPIREVVVKTLDVPAAEGTGAQWVVTNFGHDPAAAPTLFVKFGAGSQLTVAEDMHLVSQTVDVAIDAAIEYSWVFRGNGI